MQPVQGQVVQGGVVQGGIVQGGVVQGGVVQGGVVQGGYAQPQQGVVQGGVVQGGVVQGGVVQGGVVQGGYAQPQQGVVQGAVVQQTYAQPAVVQVQQAVMGQPGGQGGATTVIQFDSGYYGPPPWHNGGQWKDGTFECFSNCMPSCLMGFCCMACFIPQIYEKVVKKGSCMMLTAVLVILGILGNALSGDPDLSTVGSIFYFLEWIISIYLVATARTHVRSKYSIAETQCAGMEDWCCAIWCTSCTACQIARHVYDYDKTGESCSCSPSGEPTGFTPTIWYPNLQAGGMPQSGVQMTPGQPIQNRA